MKQMMMINLSQIVHKTLGGILLLLFTLTAHASQLDELNRLKKAYPDFIKSVTPDSVIWTDGTVMSVSQGKQNRSWQEKLDAPTFADQLEQPTYVPGKPVDANSYQPKGDPGRIRFEPFFKKMYGETAEAVESKLTTVYWMPGIFKHRYPILVTTVNGVDKKLAQVSTELEQLVKSHPEFLRYLDDPAGLFNRRVIAHTNRLSAHSYGIALDLNDRYSNYWQWELEKEGRVISESTPLIYVNHIPWEIVLIFEKHGFIWGGKWHHFDTMHFEYRPEMINTD